MGATPFPRITVAGVSVPSDLDVNGFKAGFNKQRDDSFRTDRIEAVRALVREHLVPIKTIQLNTNSYRLKTWIEDALGYKLCQGEVIVAMIGEGFIYERDGVNCYFNVSQKSIKQLRACRRRYIFEQPKSPMVDTVYYRPATHRYL